MGTLVSDTYVLTAGEVFHLHKNPADWAVLPGASGLQGGQDFEVVLSWKFSKFFAGSSCRHIYILSVIAQVGNFNTENTPIKGPSEVIN